MSKPTRKSNTERRRALKLLASNADGCTEAIMLAHGFTVEFLVDNGPRRPRNRTARAHACRRPSDRGHAVADHERRPAGARGASQVVRALL